MPPPDTTYIPGETGPPPPVGEAVIDSLLQSEWMEHRPVSKNERPQFLAPEWQMFLFVFIILAASAYFYILKPDITLKKKKKNLYKSNPDDKVVAEIKYDNWLNKYNPYYNSLDGDLKKRFLHRVKNFLAAKEFRFHEMAEEEYIAVLISGAAVQITFGLKNYLMDYFPIIHVIRKEYTLKIDDETYDGHVSPTGIYVSWNHFMEGYKDYTDSVNVGLHEMAHAVSFDVYLGSEDEHDSKLKQRFREFSEDAKPVFRAMRSGASHLLDDYATTNFDEFWAVCTETFFESPQHLQNTSPDLYLSVCEVLNQDPLLPGKILDPMIAGIKPQ